MNVLFCGVGDQAETYGPALKKWSAELSAPFDLFTDPAAIPPDDVDVLIANPNAPIADFSVYEGAKLIQSIWAGMEVFLANPTLPAQPILCRMVEPGLTEGMTDYICGHVMRYHLGIDGHITDSANRAWNAVAPPLARDRKVAVLGLGQLGMDAAAMLKALRFDVAGWSRTEKSGLPYPTFHGASGLSEILKRSEIIVTILPNTAETHHVINAGTIALTPKGAAIINPGRGSLIDDDALIAALDAGRLSHATLDVFDQEPLPKDHPFWGRPDITITPHIAAETRTDGAAKVAVEQIRRLQKDEPLHYIVDRAAGY